MNRDLARLTSTAERVQADLRRTWTCSVDGDYVLSVTDGVVNERLLLAREVETKTGSLRRKRPPRS